MNCKEGACVHRVPEGGCGGGSSMCPRDLIGALCGSVLREQNRVRFYER